MEHAVATVIPYINFVDKSAKAVTFYKEVFGGDADVQSEGDRIVHLDFQSGNLHFMGSDLGNDQSGRDSSLVLNCESEDELRTFYVKLVDGGTEVFAPTDSGWGAIVAHCTDQFGVTWMLNYDEPQNS
jgi:PhnB protein